MLQPNSGERYRKRQNGMFYDLHGNQINLFSKEGVSCAVQAGLVLLEAGQGIKNHKGSWTLNYDKSVLEREMGRKIKLLKFDSSKI